MNNVAQNGEKSIIGAIKIDKKEVQEHLNTLVKESVEEVLNKLLNARRMQSAMLRGMSAVRIVLTREPERTNGNF